MLRRSDGLIRLEQGSAGQDWILARRFCAYTLLDASLIPAAKRKGFAAMAVQRWSPFADTRFHIDWVGTQAMVWAWSNAQILDAGDGEVTPPPRRVVPESIHRGEPQVEAAVLVAMDEGVEGRIWLDHAMIACQWWPGPPGIERWNDFRRGAGLGAAAILPEVQQPALAHVPWTRPRVVGFNDLAGRHRKTVQAVAVGMIAALVALPLAASLRLVVKTSLLERVIKTESESVAVTLQAREAAERDLAAVDQLLRLRVSERQLRLLSAAVAATPGDWKLLEWRMPDSRSLEVVMQMANPDATVLVRGWEAAGVFSNVAVDIGRTGNEVAIKAEIADTDTDTDVDAVPAAAEGL